MAWLLVLASRSVFSPSALTNLATCGLHVHVHRCSRGVLVLVLAFSFCPRDLLPILFDWVLFDCWSGFLFFSVITLNKRCFFLNDSCMPPWLPLLKKVLLQSLHMHTYLSIHLQSNMYLHCSSCHIPHTFVTTVDESLVGGESGAN